MEAPENKLSDQGKQYLVQLEKEGEPYAKVEREFYEKFTKRWNEELLDKKDDEPQ